MIDPIEVDEELARIRKRQDALRRRGDAALALSWFSRFALTEPGHGPREPGGSVLPSQLMPIASATPDVDRAIPYIRRAFVEYHSEILKRAIALAESDYEDGRDA